MDNRLLYRIALSQLPGIGPISAKNLISYCGTAEAVFSSSGRQLQQIPGLGARMARKILAHRDPALRHAHKEINFLEKNPDIRPIFFLDDDYPLRLKHYPDCPFMLFYRGNAGLNTQRFISIVGTRKPSHYGKKMASELVDGLAPYGVTIVSGLAYGIDAAVHQACVDREVPTIGVLGHGLHIVYPYAHRNLSAKMLAHGGLLSEFHSGLGPEKDHFPMRNRIVAGMCDALIVVETGPKGGSVISAEFANSYNKDVFAIPGRIGDPMSKGCHFLIKTNRAGLVENAEDVAYRLQWEQETSGGGKQRALFEGLDEKEQEIVDYLREADVAGIDQISRKTGINTQTLAVMILGLEFKGVLRNLPGHRYALA